MSQQPIEREGDRVRIPYSELVDLLHNVFFKNGASHEVASALSDNCASAEADGAENHGIFRIPGYVSTLRSGWVDGKAVPQIRGVTAASISVDAMNGFAQPALAVAARSAVEKAHECGIGSIAITRSHHFGALWLDVEPFVHQGLVVLTMVSGYRRVVPHGGRVPVYGTNPMAFGAPRSNGPPLIFDQASSAMSYGELLLYAQQNRTVPQGVGVDRAGNATADPRAILDGGALLCFGGHKGSSISMMIEVLAAAVTGSHFSFEVDRSQYKGAETSCSGQFMVLIDPAVGFGAACASRVDTLIEKIRESGQTRLPGDHRYQRRKQSEVNGIAVRRDALDRVHELLRCG